MAKILVTGGTGFVGSYVVPRLREAGHTIRLIVRDPTRLPAHAQGGVEVVEGDVSRPDTLAPAVAGVDAVVHLVAIIRERGGATFERINYQGTVNIVDAALAAGVRRFVQMSANGARPASEYPYFDTKFRAQQYVVESGLDYTIMQPSVIFGRGDGFITALADLVRKPLLVAPAPLLPVAGDGRAPFQPVWAGDVASAFAAALEDPATIGRVLQLGGPERLTYDELLDTVMTQLGLRRVKIHVPLPLMRPVVAVMDRLLRKPPVTTEQFKMLALDNSTPDSATARLIGRAPRRLADGIEYITEPRAGR